MKDETKTKTQLVNELAELRRQRAALEAIVAECKQKQIEQALRESDERFQAVWQIAADAMVLSDPEGIVLAANPAYCQLYGYSLAEIIGRSFAIIFPAEKRRWAIEQYKASFAAQVIPPSIEAVVRRADGTERIVETRIEFILQNGQRTAMLSIIRDITKRKEAETILRQRNQELAWLNRASQAFNSSLDLSEVLVNILEEVRPLLGVVGASIWLNDDQTGALVCHQASGMHSEVLRSWRLAPGQGIVGWVTQQGQSQIVPDAQADPRHFNNIEQKIGLKRHSILCVPLRSKQAMIGALEVVDTAFDRFSQTDLTLVESLAATATIAIENARLYEQMRQDATTRAVLLEEVNHRAFFREVIAMAHNQRAPVSLCYFFQEVLVAARDHDDMARLELTGISGEKHPDLPAFYVFLRGQFLQVRHQISFADDRNHERTLVIGPFDVVSELEDKRGF